MRNPDAGKTGVTACTDFAGGKVCGKHVPVGRQMYQLSFRQEPIPRILAPKKPGSKRCGPMSHLAAGQAGVAACTELSEGKSWWQASRPLAIRSKALCSATIVRPTKFQPDGTGLKPCEQARGRGLSSAPRGESRAAKLLLPMWLPSG